jgi:phosphoglycolate phosphatase
MDIVAGAHTGTKHLGGFNIALLTARFKNVPAIAGRMKLVIFDLDGTLQSLEIDFHGLRTKLSVLFEGYGHPPLEGPLLEAVEKALGTLPEKGMPGTEVELARQRAYHMMDSWEMASFPKARTFPGVEESLSELSSRGCRLAVQSRACRAYVQRSLERIGFDFDAVAAREDVERAKPEPEGVLMLMGRLRCQPQNTFVVGDHPFDIDAGKRAGTFCAGVLTGAGTEENLVRAGADVVFDRVGPELVNWIRGIG